MSEQYNKKYDIFMRERLPAIRVTSKQLDTINKARGIETMSDFIRNTLLEKAEKIIKGEE